jgi:peptide/nickel transport system permease protein
VRGDFGRSILTSNVISEQLAQRIPPTLELILPALLLAIVLALLLGIPAALHAGSAGDQATRLGALAANAMPEFWLGLVLILIFYSQLGIAPPPSGRIAPGLGIPVVTGFMTVDTLLAGRFDAFLSELGHLALPVITLAIAITAPLLRSVRASALEIINSEAYDCAVAHGLSRRQLLRGYLLRGTLARLPTLAALVFGTLIGGSVLVEIVFSWQGVGQWAMRGMLLRDYPVIQAFVLIVAVAYVLVFLLADVLHAALDPRVKI